MVYTLPEMYVERLLEFVSKKISSSHHVEFYLSWATKLLTTHASKENVFKQHSLISIQDSLQRKYDALSAVCDFNKYTLKVLQEMAETNASNDQITDADDQDSGDSDSKDFNENDLILINSSSNEAQNRDVDMQSDYEQSDDGMSTDDT